MDYKNQPSRPFAILEAASPYLTPQGQYAVALLLQANSFANLAKAAPSSPDAFSLEASEVGRQQTNPPAFPDNIRQMLITIQEYLTPQETDLTRSLLNILNAGKLMNNYRDFVHTQSLSACENPDKNKETKDNPNMMRDFLLSQLSPEQKATFEQLRNIMYNEGGI